MKVSVPEIIHEKIKYYAEVAGMTQSQVAEIIFSGYFHDATSADTLKQIIRIHEPENGSVENEG